MCGLIGYFGEWKHNAEQAFLDLLRIGVLRGSDSTGVAFVNTNGATRICKDVLLPEHLIKSKDFEKITKNLWNGFIGHNRLATKGEINKRNAHPFSFGNIIGAHNGTLISQHRLPDSDNFKVDSENIIYSINKLGIKETWKKTHGAAALTWWNNKEKTLNLLRNDDRMLCFAKTIKSEGVFWASEAWMIRVASERNDIEIDVVYELPKDVLYTYSLTSESKHDRKLNLSKSSIEGFAWPSINVGYAYNRSDDFYGDKWYDNDYGKDKKIDALYPSIDNNEKKKEDGYNVEEFKSGKYAVTPKHIIRVVHNKNIKSIKLICVLYKQPNTRVEIKLTENEATTIERYIPGKNQLFSDIIFIVDINKLITIDKKIKKIDLIGNAKTIKIVAPKNCYRTMLSGAQFTKEQFIKAKVDCCYCNDPLDFLDIDLEEDPQSDNVLCGKCSQASKSKQDGEFSAEDIFKIARNE